MYDIGFRKAALICYEYIGSLKSTAKMLKIGIATIWRWVNNGIDRKTRIKRTYPEFLMSFVKCQVNKNNTLTQKELRHQIKESLNVQISKGCLATILKLLNLSRKRLRKRGYCEKQRYNERFEIFKTSINSVSLDTLISIDEVGFDQRMTPIYGYSEKNTKAITVTHPTNRQRINVIMAVDNQGNYFYELIIGSVTSDLFNQFIQSLPWTDGNVILDNVSFHKTTKVINTMKEKSFKPLFIAPYTPECNPIENVFSVIKNTFRKKSIDLNSKQEDIIVNTIESLDTSIFSRCFYRMINFLKK